MTGIDWWLEIITACVSWSDGSLKIRLKNNCYDFVCDGCLTVRGFSVPFNPNWNGGFVLVDANRDAS